MDEPAMAGGQCPTCAATYESGATFCASCGAPLTEAPTEADLQADLQTVRIADGAKQCSWCGATNPDDALACQGCGAAFPRPEQDAALLRASQERIRMANDTIATLRRGRERKRLGRLFGR
jgi:uncharacterized membrane protein YvbJ